MTSADTQPCCVVLCVDDETPDLEAIARDVRSVCGKSIAVETCTDAEEAVALVKKLRDRAIEIPLIIADHALPGVSGADMLIALHEEHGLHTSRKIILSGHAALEDVSKALNRGALNRHLAKPWQFDELRACIRDLLTEYVLEVAPAQVQPFAGVIDVSRISKAYRRQRQTLRDLGSQMRRVQRSFLVDLEMSDEEAEAAMIAALDQALDHPRSQRMPAGTILLEEGQVVDGIFVMRSGRVELSRTIDSRKFSFHAHTTGRIVGLLALSQRRKAFFRCEAVTEVEVTPVSLQELDDALQKDPTLSIHFVSVLVRTLANRSRRVAALMAKVERLNSDLVAERDNVAAALRQLEQAQMRLVESEKLATLGQLSAGVAHELNNPVAAMQRAADFLAEDIIALVATRPEGEQLRAVTLAALTDTPLSTRESRDRRERLAEELRDTDLARRLIKVGITTADAYRTYFGNTTGAERDRLFGLMERYHQLGTSLRNISRCSDHIARIVQSLRSYARTDAGVVDNVNVHAGLDDTLLMFGHALRDVEVEKEYGDIPTIECHPGEINQVWTNLISNALQAMDDRGSLAIRTDAPDDRHVRVRIIDSGPGVSPELLSRVFEMDFTTKIGQRQFGMGMGLPICRQIVNRHGGTITLDSRPGETTATVILPVSYQALPREGRRT